MPLLAAIKDLDHHLNEGNNLQQLGDDLDSLSTLLRSGERQFLVVAEQDATNTAANHLDQYWAGSPSGRCECSSLGI